LRFVIYGAGGIGGVIGAELFLAGHDVILIARGTHLAAIQENGLTYQRPQQTRRLSIPAVSHPREFSFQPDDAVIMTMKSQHTRDALNDLAAHAPADTRVICCQNGVENERMALRRFPNVYAMLVILPAASLEPGVVQTHATGNIGILDAGRYPGGTDEFIARVTSALETADLTAKPNPKVMRFKYRKLIMNLGNALQACCPPGDETRKIRRLLRQEAETCFNAAGIEWASDEENNELRKAMSPYAEIDGQPRPGGSSWQSIMRGTGDIEADYLNGEIVLLGRLHGIPTPANFILQQAANELARSGGEAQSIPASEIIRRIEMAA
jgi:2-dehydropantoate 2-reductase